MKKISKEIALQLGLKRYFTGVPCKNGHICERYTNACQGRCVECHRLARQRQRARDPEQAQRWSRLSKRKQKARDPERVRQQWREWFARQKVKERNRPDI